MAKIKSPLQMADGAKVRTMEELREHFDMASVLAYYDSGKLQEWLENYYYDEEADEISALDPSSTDIKEKICGILGVSCPRDEAGNISLADVSDKNKRLEKLKKYTGDDEFLKAVDYVAFTQEELQGLLDGGIKMIYLCQEQGEFEIPGIEGVTYIGVNHPSVSAPEWFGEKGIVFQNVDIGIEELFHSAGEYSKHQDYTKAVKLWSKAAALGNVEAQRELGRCYYKGEGVTQDYDEACKWYGKAAEQGDADAQNMLVLLCKSGNAEARKWYNKTAEQGDADTQRKLGDCYYYGNDVKKDYAEACKWYRKAAEQGNTDAQYLLGTCYYKGDGVAKDHAEACKWYKKAAEQGNADAQYLLGTCYYDGNGVAQDHAEACRWYRKAAEQGNVDAQFMLGVCYYNGNGVAQNHAEACKWYKKAAEQGDADAQNIIDSYYAGGNEEAIQEKSRRTEFEAYVANCKKFLGLIHRMPRSWDARNGELNSHRGRVQYAKFLNGLVNNLDAKSQLGHIIYNNISNLRTFTQIMFSRYKELRIKEIYMNGDPDYGEILIVNSDISIVWNEEESNTLKEDFEKYISVPSEKPEHYSVKWMEANSASDVYLAFQCFSMFSVRTDTHECLYKQFFDSLLKKLDGNDEMLDEVIALSKQYPIVYSKDLETAFIWKYETKEPYIEIKYGNQNYKYVPALVHLQAYETLTVLVHFCNMPLSNYTSRYALEKNEYTELDFASLTSTTGILAEVEWGNWLSEDVCELKITKNNDSALGELIINITVDEVESAVAVIKNI